MNETPDLLAGSRWLYRYHGWARQRLLGDCRQLTAAQLHQPGVIAGGNEDGSVFGTLAHLANGGAVWLARWLGEGEARPRPAGASADLDSLERVWADVEPRRAAWLAGLEAADLTRLVRYRSSSLGVVEAFPVWQTLQHVSGHMVHHRAEVCVALTALGVAPRAIDLMAYMREGADPAGG